MWKPQNHGAPIALHSADFLLSWYSQCITGWSKAAIMTSDHRILNRDIYQEGRPIIGSLFHGIIFFGFSLYVRMVWFEDLRDHSFLPCVPTWRSVRILYGWWRGQEIQRMDYPPDGQGRMPCLQPKSVLVGKRSFSFSTLPQLYAVLGYD